MIYAFFVRNNNDIDHIVPVAWKIASNGGIVNLVITTHPAYRRDHRISFLSSNQNVNVYHILDFIPIKATERIKILRNILNDKKPNEINFPDVWKDYCQNSIFFKAIIEKLFLNNKKCVACFDWISTPFVLDFLKILKEFRIKTVSLPHGINVFINQLVAKDMINFNSIVQNSKLYNLFDHVVVANLLGKKYFSGSIQEKRIHVLGSPRYCREWREVVSSLIRMPSVNIANNARLKVAFFLRDQGYDIFWDEVLRTYLLILQFSDVHLIVKHHPRSGGQNILKRLHPRLFSLQAPNLTIQTDEGSSVPLVEWADLVVDSGTSITIEAALCGKPVLCLEYLHPNRTVMAEHIRNCDIQTRDQLYNWIEIFLENKKFEFYGEELQYLESLWINNHDVDILGKYDSFLKNVADGNI